MQCLYYLCMTTETKMKISVSSIFFSFQIKTNSCHSWMIFWIISHRLNTNQESKWDDLFKSKLHNYPYIATSSINFLKRREDKIKRGESSRKMHFNPPASQVALVVKNMPANAGDAETRVWSLGGEEPLEKERTTHSSILAWRIPRTEEPDRLQSMVLGRVGHDWRTKHTEIIK